MDQALTFAVEVESGKERSDVLNYDEVRNDIIEKLELLRDTPVSTAVLRVSLGSWVTLIWPVPG